MLIQVTRLMTGVIVVSTWLLGHALVAMPLFIQVTGSVAGVIVMRARDFLYGLIPMSVLIEVTRGMTGVIVVLTRLLLRHDVLLVTDKRDQYPVLVLIHQARCEGGRNEIAVTGSAGLTPPIRRAFGRCSSH